MVPYCVISVDTHRFSTLLNSTSSSYDFYHPFRGTSCDSQEGSLSLSSPAPAPGLTSPAPGLLGGRILARQQPHSLAGLIWGL